MNDTAINMNQEKIQQISTEEQAQLAKFAKALAHPIRLEILKLLSSQSCCFTGDLVEVLPIAQSTVSQHLKELKSAGLIQGHVDPPKTKYCIDLDNWHRAKDLFATFFADDANQVPGLNCEL